MSLRAGDEFTELGRVRVGGRRAGPVGRLAVSDELDCSSCAVPAVTGCEQRTERADADRPNDHRRHGISRSHSTRCRNACGWAQHSLVERPPRVADNMCNRGARAVWVLPNGIELDDPKMPDGSIRGNGLGCLNDRSGVDAVVAVEVGDRARLSEMLDAERARAMTVDGT